MSDGDSDGARPLPLPPRKDASPKLGPKATMTPLETLLAMGFPRSRADKALAATGNRGVNLAADWLVAHVKDPHLDVMSPRCFFLYLCPSAESPLSVQLQTFWDASRTQIGWNGAHNSPPHVTLISELYVPDADVDHLLGCVRKVYDGFADDLMTTFGGICRGGVVSLEKYISPNYLGLFVGKNEEILLRSFSGALSSEVGAVLGIHADGVARDSRPSNSGFHLTLAYQFPPHQFAGLQDLADALEINDFPPSEWELRLYSCDAKLESKEDDNVEVHRVVYPYSPCRRDELELRTGDLVYIDSSALDGWVLGTSWLTGSTGYLPKNYVERAAKCDAWTLHLTLPLNGEILSSSSSSSMTTLSLAHHRRLSSYSTSSFPVPTPLVSSSPHSAATSTKKSGRRQIFIVRHGERVDFTFGSWIDYSFKGSGSRSAYQPRDLNMPPDLPRRSGGPEAFTRDCPLTRIGCVQARLTGEAMKEASISIAHIYSSPSLRCLQTAHHLLLGLGRPELKIHVEPGLFEWLAWYQDSMPNWMSLNELSTSRYNVDLNYEPYISADELQDAQSQQPESVEQYYTRNFFVTRCILQATEESGGNLLFVAHAGTLDACSRQVTGKEPRSFPEMMNIVREVAYCGVALLQEKDTDANDVKKSAWQLAPIPFPPLTHCSNPRFDWKSTADKL